MEAIMTVVRQVHRDEAALRKARMLIGGKWVESASGDVLEVEDPAHRRPVAEVPRGGAEDVARAVNAAADAFPAWSRTIPRERGRLLARIADALEARIEELARTIALETGNALRTQARPEAKTSVDIMRYFGGLGGELKGETIPLGEQVLSYTRREPFGVVGAIVPWNAPVLLAALNASGWVVVSTGASAFRCFLSLNACVISSYHRRAEHPRGWRPRAHWPTL